MPVIRELLRTEDDGSLSFGDYTLKQKTKLENFEFEGDIYKVKTFEEITKLERNGMLVYESVPGSAVENFYATDRGVAFRVYSEHDLEITLELEPESCYEVFIDEASVGQMGTNLSGKLTAGVEACKDEGTVVEIVKC